VSDIATWSSVRVPTFARRLAQMKDLRRSPTERARELIDLSRGPRPVADIAAPPDSFARSIAAILASGAGSERAYLPEAYRKAVIFSAEVWPTFLVDGNGRRPVGIGRAAQKEAVARAEAVQPLVRDRSRERTGRRGEKLVRFYAPESKAHASAAMTKAPQIGPVLTLRELNRGDARATLPLERARVGIVPAIERLAALTGAWSPSPYIALWSRPKTSAASSSGWRLETARGDPREAHAAPSSRFEPGLHAYAVATQDLQRGAWNRFRSARRFDRRKVRPSRSVRTPARARRRTCSRTSRSGSGGGLGGPFTARLAVCERATPTS